MRAMAALLRAGIASLTIVSCSPRQSAPSLAPAPVVAIDGGVAAVTAQLRRLTDATSQPGASASTWGELGRHYMIYELDAEAMTCFDNARRLDRHDARWPYYLGALHQRRGAYREAMASFDAVLTLEPDDAATHLRLAAIHEELGAAAEMRRHLERARVAERTVRFPDPRMDELDALRQHAWLEVARATLRDPNALADDYLNYTLSRVRGNPSAARVLRADLEQHASDPVIAVRFRRVLAALDHAAGNHDEAIAELQRAVESSPDEVVAARLQLSAVLIDSGRLAEAVVQLDGVLGRQPGHTSARRDRALALVELGRGAEIVDDLDRLIEERPRDADLLRAAGATALSLGRTELAIERYEAALAIDVDDRARAADFVGLCNAQRAEGRLEPALAAARAAVELVPDAPGAWLNVAATAAQLQRFDECAPAYAEVVRLIPMHGPAWRGEALCLLHGRSYLAARDHLDEAIRALPADEGLRHLLARLLASAPNDDVRDGERALWIARALYGRRPTPERGATLAMALAETGAFSEAVALARDQAPGDLIAERRLEGYRAQRAWRATSVEELITKD